MKMKLSELMVMIAIMLMTTAFANAGTMHDKNSDEYIRVMRQASVELKTSNSDLSRKLSEYADSKKDWNNNRGEKYENFLKDAQVLRNVATVLQADGKDDLYDQVTGVADRLQRKTEKIKNLTPVN